MNAEWNPRSVNSSGYHGPCHLKHPHPLPPRPRESSGLEEEANKHRRSDRAPEEQADYIASKYLPRRYFLFTKRNIEPLWRRNLQTLSCPWDRTDISSNRTDRLMSLLVECTEQNSTSLLGWPWLFRTGPRHPPPPPLTHMLEP